MKPWFCALQPFLPHHLISRFIGLLANSRWRPLKNWLISRVSQWYNITLEDYLIEDPLAFKSFNEFFTRALKPDARPIDARDEHIVCPVDGSVSQIGAINDEQIIQAKGKHYSASSLLGDDQCAAVYQQGQFATLYLAPNNYHRIHMPIDATLTSLRYIPGRLFSVNQQSARHIERVFARNERLVAQFHSECGPMALVMVGALNVGSMETVHQGVVAPNNLRSTTDIDISDMSARAFAKGQEFGRFNLGSTVILLFAQKKIVWNPKLEANSTLKMGMSIATRYPH